MANAANVDIDNHLLLALNDGLIDDEEYVLLRDVNKKRMLNLPHKKYNRFDLEQLEGDECKAYLRFEKDDVHRLNNALRIPPSIICKNGAVFNGIEALCVFLRRFSYPCRYVDMMPMFGRSIPELCMACSEVMDFIYNEYHHLLHSFDQSWLAPDKLHQFAERVSAKGAPLQNCWGFIDGTVRAICRPGEMQRIMYNGHKRVHAIKFQSVVAPNGMIVNMCGPYEGKRHDSGMLADSGLLNQLQQYSNDPDGNPLCIYGDPAYPLRVHLQCPFRGQNLTNEQKLYNTNMSQVRVSVEWVFNEIVNFFKFLDFKRNLKMNLSAVGKMYLVCALMTNAHTILYKSVTTSFFELDPPELEEYFQLRR